MSWSGRLAVNRVNVNKYILVVALAAVSVGNARAQPSSWRTSWDGNLYGYADTLSPRGGSPLNPGNRIARLSDRGITGEGRFYLKAEGEDLRLTLRPIIVYRRYHSDFGESHQSEGYLSQWQVRLRLAEAWNAAVGREVLNWGPAQFRSPSSPFFFDNGRGNPMRELSGVDAAKLSWTPDRANAVTLAYVNGAGHGRNDDWKNSGLLKIDRRGDNWAGGLALVHIPNQGLFVGIHDRYIFSDAIMLYAEAGSSTRANALQSPAALDRPFSILPRSPRRATVLLGAAYTYENGQTLNAEYLHDGHGYTAAQARAYFARAASSPLLAGLALGNAPPLLGRDYLHLVWQSNLMESDYYWRVMMTHGFTDGTNEWSAYGEYALNSRAALFGLFALPVGSVRQEFSSLYSRSLTVGVRIAVP